MKSLILCSILFTSLSTFAEADIEKVKTEATARMDKRIAMLQEAKTCVAAATTKEAVRTCQKNLREDHNEMKNEMKGKREGFKAERMNRKK